MTSRRHPHVLGLAVIAVTSGCSVFPSVDRVAPGVLLERIDMGAPETPFEAAEDFVPRRSISESGIALISEFEGESRCARNLDRHCPYNDASDYCTIGHGHLIAKKPCESIKGELSRLGYSSGLTEREASELLRIDLALAQRGVEVHMTSDMMGMVGLTDYQYDSLVSFVYNVGSGNFSRSTLLREIQARTALGDSIVVAEQFLLWINSGGMPLRGLLERRRREVEHFFTGFGTLDVFGDPGEFEFGIDYENLIDIREGETP